MAAAPTPNAAALIGVLNKVMKYAVGLGIGASALQSSLYNGEVDCSFHSCYNGCQCSS